MARKSAQPGWIALGLTLMIAPAHAGPIAGVDFEDAANTGWDRAPDDLDLADGITVSADWNLVVTGNLRNDAGANAAGASGGNFPGRLQSDGSWSITIPDTVVLNLTSMTFDARGATGSTGAPSGRSGSFGTSLDGGLDATPLWSNPNLLGRPTWTPVTVNLSDALYQGLTDTIVTFYWNGTSAIDLDTIVLSGTTGPIPSSTLLLTITPATSPATGYDLEWASRSGMLYSVRSSADLTGAISTWTLVENEIPADPSGTNTKNVKPPESALFYAVEEAPAPPPPPLLAENFDAAAALPGGWSSNPSNGTAWEVGGPSGEVSGPSAAGSAPNCAGTNISGYYTENADATLTTPSIAIPAGSGGTLSFKQFIDTDLAGSPPDLGSVRILDADNSDTPIAGLEITDIQGDGTAGWTNETLGLPAGVVGGKNIRIEFRFVSNAGTLQGLNVFGGFYVDDVVVTRTAP